MNRPTSASLEIPGLIHLLQQCLTSSPEEVERNNKEFFDNFNKKSSCVIKDRANVQALACSVFSGVLESPNTFDIYPNIITNMIDNAKITEKLPNPRQLMKDYLLESIRNVERFVKININNQKPQISAQIIGIISLIAHLYNKDLVDGEIIFNWIVNVLVSRDKRHTMLTIIKEKIKKLVESKRADSVTMAVDKIIREEKLDGDDEIFEDEWMEVESVASIDESDGSTDYISWFQTTFAKDIPNDISNYRKYSKTKRQKFAKIFAMIIDLNISLIPPLANFFEQFMRNVDMNFKRDFFALVEKLKKDELKFSFLYAIDKFTAELCLIDVEMVDEFMKNSLELQTNQNDRLDICFLLNFKKLGRKLRKVDQNLHEECLNYVKKLYKKSKSDESQICDLFNLNDIKIDEINPIFMKMVMDIINGVKTLDMNFILSNPSLHAKFIFLKALEHTEIQSNFAKAILKLGQHPHHKIIKPMIAALCEESFEEQNKMPNEKESQTGLPNLLKFIAELFNVGVIESKIVENILAILCENNSLFRIYSFALITRVKVEQNVDQDFAGYKELLLDVSRQSAWDIQEIKRNSILNLKPDQKLVLYLQKILDGTSTVQSFDPSIIKNSESHAKIAKVLVSRTTRSEYLMTNFPIIFKTIQSHNKDFEDAFCYTIMLRASALIKSVLKRDDIGIKESWKQVYNTGKLMAILYNKNIVDNLHRRFFKLLMEIRQESRDEDAICHEGLYVMIKLFMEVSEKYKKEQFEIYLQVMDIIYEIKETQKHSRNFSQLLKIRREVLSDFEDLNPIDSIPGNVNPSMRFAISRMSLQKPYDILNYYVDVIDAKQSAKCFYYHAIKHFYDNKGFVDFLSTWSKIVTQTKERSSFIDEVVTLCIKSFVEQIKKKKNLEPVRSIMIAKFAAKLFLAGIIEEEIYIKFIETVADCTVFNLCDLNYRCLEAILRAAEFKRLKNCEKYFKLRDLILDRKKKIYQSEIDDQNIEPEVEEYNPKIILSLDQPTSCLEILFDDILYRAKREHLSKVQEHFKACCTFQGLHKNFKTIFDKKVEEYIFILTEVPRVQSFEWDKFAKFAAFIGFCNCYMNNTNDKGKLFEKFVKNLYQVSQPQFAKFFLNVVLTLGFPPGSFYVAIIDEMFANGENSSQELKNIIKLIILNYDKSINLKVTSDQVSPSIKALIHGIITSNPYSGTLTINNIKDCAKFYFDNAVFYPLSHIEEFVKNLKSAKDLASSLNNGEVRQCSELWKIIAEVATLCDQNFFKLDMRRDLGCTKLATFMFLSNLFPHDKYLNFIENVLYFVSIHPTYVTLLRYKHSMSLIDPALLVNPRSQNLYDKFSKNLTYQCRLKEKTENYKKDEDLDGPVPPMTFDDCLVLEECGQRFFLDPYFHLNNPQYNVIMNLKIQAMKKEKERQDREKMKAGRSSGAVPKRNLNIESGESSLKEIKNVEENSQNSQSEVSKKRSKRNRKKKTEVLKNDKQMLSTDNLKKESSVQDSKGSKISENTSKNIDQKSQKNANGSNVNQNPQGSSKNKNHNSSEKDPSKDFQETKPKNITEVVSHPEPVSNSIKYDSKYKSSHFQKDIENLIKNPTDLARVFIPFFITDKILTKDLDLPLKHYVVDVMKSNDENYSHLVFINVVKMIWDLIGDSKVKEIDSKVLLTLFEFFVELTNVSNDKNIKDLSCSEFCLFFKETFVILNHSIEKLSEILQNMSLKLIDSALPDDIEELINFIRSQNAKDDIKKSNIGTRSFMSEVYIERMLKQLTFVKSNLKIYKKALRSYQSSGLMSDEFLNIFTRILIDFVIKVELSDLNAFVKFLIEKIYIDKSEKIAKVGLKKLKNVMTVDNSTNEVFNLLNFAKSLHDNKVLKSGDVDGIFNVLINENLKYLKIFMKIFPLDPSNNFYDVIESKMKICSKNELEIYKEIIKNDKEVIKFDHNNFEFEIDVKTQELDNFNQVSDFILFIWKFYNEK